MLFTVYDIRDCLYDKKRTMKLAAAIKSVVKEGDIVADAGSGSGILGLLALKYGAKRVYTIELNKRYKKIIEQNAKLNRFNGKIGILYGDARKIRLPEKVDVILCELIHTGTFFEPQMQVINNLKKYLRAGGRVVPETLYSFIELVNAKENFYGLNLSYDSRPEISETVLSEPKLFDKIDFNEDEPVKLHTVVKLKAIKSQVANAVRVTGKLILTKKIHLGESKHILMPEIIFLRNPFRVKKGGLYYLEISYSGGTDTLNAKIESIQKPTSRILKNCNYLPEKII